uniref:EGF-like domain-containing protein n=1 Tax=Ascaris lumbricoides TaxID=6252 RepID=A0A9J2Q363_ASCLU
MFSSGYFSLLALLNVMRQVIWERNQCFDIFAGVASNQVCAKQAFSRKNSHSNRNAYVGIACECDQRYGIGDGFRCMQTCDRQHEQKIKRCGSVNEQCYIESSSGQPVCGCGPGFRANMTSDGKTVCLPEDLCGSCKFACHKASKCMPPTKGSGYGYTCDRCDPRKGYTGDGFTCKDIDECADEKLNKCDRPNAICINKSPVEDDGLKYVCQCKSGWRADPNGGYQWRKCKDTNECLMNALCGKYAKCVNTPGSYYCSCLNGFTKAFENITECIDIDECTLQKPCGENAYCINTVGSFVCKCKQGFIATKWKNYCKPDINYWCKRCDKKSTICVLNQANDGYKCACKNGFQALPGDTNRCIDIPNCSDASMNDCDKTPGYATCTDIPGGYRCTCNQGFTGDGRKCTPSNPCSRHNPCANIGGTECFDDGGKAKCRCKQGFVRPFNDRHNEEKPCFASNPCSRHNPCANIGGTECFDDGGKAKCRCKQGFVRPFNDRHNEEKPCFDETTANVYSCNLCDNATSFCQRLDKNPPFYACRCADGYIMNAAGRCTNINECMRISENNCDPNANCIDREPAIDGIRYECSCKKGFSGNGTMGHCVDINECNGTIKVCRLPHQICANTIGSYQCDCEEGYMKLPGLQACTNINECEQGIADCPPNSRCEDRDPGYVCKCLSGFTNKTSNGKMICSNIDECKEGVGPIRMSACDAVNGICKDTIGSYLCSCKHGFMLQADGKTCGDIDECKRGEDTCDWQVQICNNTIGSFRCDCKYGLISKGGICEDRDECKDGSNKCLRHSRCINTFSSYRCECEDGFTPAPSTHPLRPKCEHPNYCDAEFTCPKHATCVNSECACESGYRWIESDIFPRTVESLKHRPACKAIDPCAEGDLCPSPLKCKSTGPGLYECVCKDGYEKIPSNQGICIDIDECLDGTAECDEHAICKNTMGSYECDCKEGFFGDGALCMDIDECNPADPKDSCNRTTQQCNNLLGTYECKCKRGYKPIYGGCQDIDECNPADPKDNCNRTTQQCNNLLGTYECKCKRGYKPIYGGCQDIDECRNIPSPCPPTSVDLCVNTQGGFKCTCRTGFKKPRNCHGNSNCPCVDINECKQGIVSRNGTLRSACGEAAKCSNTLGGYKCVCAPGYGGDPYVDGCKGKSLICHYVNCLIK